MCPAHEQLQPSPRLTLHAHGPCAEARREGASAGELEAAAGLVALDALRIACRAAHNRAALTQLGILPALSRLMKVLPAPACVLRLLTAPAAMHVEAHAPEVTSRAVRTYNFHCISMLSGTFRMQQERVDLWSTWWPVSRGKCSAIKGP